MKSNNQPNYYDKYWTAEEVSRELEAKTILQGKIRINLRNYEDAFITDPVKFDLNNSGSISPEELRVVLSKMHRFYSREEVEDMIRKVDHNKDGLISIDEFVDMMNLNNSIN